MADRTARQVQAAGDLCEVASALREEPPKLLSAIDLSPCSQGGHEVGSVGQDRLHAIQADHVRSRECRELRHDRVEIANVAGPGLALKAIDGRARDAKVRSADRGAGAPQKEWDEVEEVFAPLAQRWQADLVDG